MSHDSMLSITQARLSDRLGEAIPLQSVSITGDLKGAMFEAQVRQSFQNSKKIPIEVVYSFPLPYDAALLSVEAQLGQIKLSGSVIATPEATERYENALSEGDAAIMLERGADGHYVLNLGNLAPNEQCTITLTYGQLLSFEQGGLRLAIPTVIAPRYGDPLRAGRLAPHQVPDTDVLAEYGFNLSLTLHQELAAARIASPSHPISVAHQATNLVATVNLAKESYLDRDFILVLDQLSDTSLVTVGADYVDPKKFVATASFCPSIPQVGKQSTTVKILVDCSGSMGGGSMTAARSALMSVIRKFKAGDKFSLSKFGSDIEHCSRALWSVSSQSVVSAERWITQLDASMGGTDIPGALESTLALAHSGPCDVLFITDGQTHEVQDAIEKAKAAKHRIFTVGIGTSPSEGLLHRLAAATGGASDFISAGEAVEPAIVRMFNRLRSPSIQEIQVIWPKGLEVTQQTPISNALFDGDTVHVSAWFNEPPSGVIRLTGKVAGQPITQEIGAIEFKQAAQAQAEEHPAVSTAVSRIAAAETLATIESEERQAEVAVAYQLVTKYTNFLMIHERSAADKATQMPTLDKVPQMLPAGWGGTSAIRHLSMDAIDSIHYLQASVSMDSASFCLKDFSIPSLLRNPRPSMSHPKKKIVRDTTHYEVPHFLRRMGEDYTPVYLLGETLRIKADSIWFFIEQNQEKILALITDHPSDPGVRVWFTNGQNEIFDYMDFKTSNEAVVALRQRGFEDQIKSRFSLLRRFRTRYVWRCEDHTRRYSQGA